MDQPDQRRCASAWRRDVDQALLAVEPLVVQGLGFRQLRQQALPVAVIAEQEAPFVPPEAEIAAGPEPEWGCRSAGRTSGLFRGAPTAATPGWQETGRTAGAYRRYVETGLTRDDEEFVAAYRESRLGLGSAEFAEHVRRWHEQGVGQARRREDVALRRQVAHKMASAVLEAVAAILGAAVSQQLVAKWRQVVREEPRWRKLAWTPYLLF